MPVLSGGRRAGAARGYHFTNDRSLLMIDDEKDQTEETPSDANSTEESKPEETATEKDDGAVSDTELDEAAGGIKIWM